MPSLPCRALAPTLGLLAAATVAWADPSPPRADFAGRSASREARKVAHWALASGTSGGRPYLVVDKQRATLFVFNALGRLVGKSPVLLGAARGDHSVPGIGDRPLDQVLPHERTTPAGRFIGEPGRNLRGEDILWVDYDVAVSMHRVRATNPAERRLQRLASRTAADNRISWGCINVPAAFYDKVLMPAIATRAPAIYVLPEQRALHEVFVGMPPERGAPPGLFMRSAMAKAR